MHVTVPMDRDYHAKAKAFGKERGFPSTAQLMRTALDVYMKGDDTSMIEKQLRPLIDMLRTIEENNGQTQEWIERVDMHLQTKEGLTPVVIAAAVKIYELLIPDEMDISGILKKLKSYDRETKYAALILLQKLKLTGSYRKRGEVQKNEEDKEE